MEARYSREGKNKKRTKMRRICPLCNELCLNEKEKVLHYSGTLHKYMKRRKRIQYSYTKNLRSLDEKIKASEGQNEPLVGLEYIYQYAADKRGVIPHVCTLCDCVYKLDTIFYHIAGIKHRCLYLSKNFPAMGIDRHFRVKTPSDVRKILNAAEIVEKSHGRKKINVSNSFFNPKKNGGMTYDSESGGECLSSSEDEEDNPHSKSTTSKPKPLLTDEWSTSKGGVGNQKGNLPFQHDLNVDRGGPAFQYDEHSAITRPLRNHGDSGFQRDRNICEDIDSLPMELSYQQRGPDSRKFTGRADFPGDRNPSYEMHRSEMPFEYDDIKGPTLQGGPRHTDSQVRKNDRDFAFQLDQSTQLLGNPRGDFGLPSIGLLHGDRSLPSQMHRGGAPFEYDDRQEPKLDGGPLRTDRQLRNNDRDFALQRDQSMGDHGIPSLGPLRQQVDRDGFKGQNRTSSHPPNFPGDRDLGSRTHRDDRKEFQYDDRQSLLEGGPRLTDKQEWKNERDFTFRPDQNMRSLDNPRGDFDMPSMESLRQQGNRDGFKGQNKTPSLPPLFPGDHDPSYQMRKDEMAFQRDDRRAPTLQGGPRESDNQLRISDRDFASRLDQSKRLPGDLLRDPIMPAIRPLLQKVDDDFESLGRTKDHPPGFLGDHNFSTPMHKDRMGLVYDDRPAPMLLEGPRHTENRGRKDGRDFAFRGDELGNAHGDPDMSSMGPLQVDSSDLKGINRTLSNRPSFSEDRSSRMHRDVKAFPYDDKRVPILQGGHKTDDQVRNHDRDLGFRQDQSKRSLGNIHSDFDLPSMGPLDREDFKGQKRTQAHSPGFPGDLDFQSEMHRVGTSFQYDDGQNAMPQDSAFQLNFQKEQLSQRLQGRMLQDEVLTFQELKVAHEAGLDLGWGGMDEQGVEDDSDMEVRSMDLSDCDPDEILCNAELFEFLKTFEIKNYEDEQFAMKVRDFFTNGSIRYKNHQEEALKKRIAEAKKSLEEEKKAFLELQKSKERPKKERPKSSATAPRKIQAPPVQSSKPVLPVIDSNNTGLVNKPIPLMSLVVDPIPPPGPAKRLPHSPSSPRGAVTEQRPPTMPTMKKLSERPSRWEPVSIQTSPEMPLGERSNQPLQREEFFPSRECSDDTRNLPSRFPPPEREEFFPSRERSDDTRHVSTRFPPSGREELYPSRERSDDTRHVSTRFPPSEREELYPSRERGDDTRHVSTRFPPSEREELYPSRERSDDTRHVSTRFPPSEREELYPSRERGDDTRHVSTRFPPSEREELYPSRERGDDTRHVSTRFPPSEREELYPSRERSDDTIHVSTRFPPSEREELYPSRERSDDTRHVSTRFPPSEREELYPSRERSDDTRHVSTRFPPSEREDFFPLRERSDDTRNVPSRFPPPERGELFPSRERSDDIRNLPSRFPQSEREEFYPSREHSDNKRNLPSRFPPHRGSVKY
ncbi:uncharacterized protein LOC143942880 [Lithobates pipiens]